MMNKIRAAIVDDEKNNADLLKIEIEAYCPEVEVVCVCYSAKEALKSIPVVKPTLVFIDIEMPHFNGFEIIEIMQNQSFHIVFVTAHSGYVLQALKASAVDYILKPVSKSTLQAAVVAFKNKVARDQQNIKALMINMEDAKAGQLHRIALPGVDGLVFQEIKNIIYFHADDIYAYVYLDDDTKLFLTKPLKYFEEILIKHRFFRVHKSYLINLDRIYKYVKGDGGYLIMNNKDHIPISKSKKDAFLLHINEK
jgi:two-component system, LytTR family, response regulator